MKKTNFLKIVGLFLLLSSFQLSFAQSTYLGDGVTDYGKPYFFSTQFPAKTAFAIDASGNKWIGTNTGLVKLADTAWTLYNNTNAPWTNNAIRSLFAEGNKVYVGTLSKITVYNNGTWSALDTSANGNITATKIFVKNNIFYCATNSNVLKIFDGTQWTSLTSPCGTITAINVDNNNKIWLGCSAGLACHSDTTWEILDQSAINCLTLSDNNRMWVGTKLNGVFYFESGVKHTLQEIIPNEIIPPNGVISLAKVPGGEVYIPSLYVNADNSTTMKGKLIKISNISSFAVYKILEYDGSTSNGLVNYSTLLDNDPSGKLWFINKTGASPNLYCITNVNDLKKFKENSANLDINNVKARYFYEGSMFWDLQGKAQYEVPKGSGKTSLFAGGLWIGGKDQNGLLHLAAEKYRSSGADYFAGPIMDSIHYASESAKWSRIWKLNKHQVEYHINHWSEPNYIMPEDILEWPGNGNTDLGQAFYLAPFIDYNNNAIYDPEYGDYPKIKGDQAVYFIINDAKLNHTETQGKKFNFEIHGMAYAYRAPHDTSLNNTTFLNYRIINRSQNTYDSLTIGVFNDFDLGDATDDYIGCDTTLNTFYVFNGKSIDGTGQPQAYGGPTPPPPAQSVCFLNDKMASFAYYNNGACADMCDPTIAQHYFNYLTNRWKDGSHVKFGGTGHSTDTAAINCNYMFPDYVANAAWSEKQSLNPPGDRRGVGAIKPFTLHPGEEKSIELAFVWAQAPSGDESSSVTRLLQHTNQVKNTIEYKATGTLKGKVKYSGGFLNANTASVHIYQAFNNTSGTYKQAAMITADGNFFMPNVDPGEYILKVSLLDNTYPSLLNTFYDTTIFWQHANFLFVSSNDTTNVLINMKEFTPMLAGNGSISGTIHYGLEPGTKGISLDKGVTLVGEPVPGAEIYVELEPDDQPIANTQTDEDGFYIVTGLAENHNYKLRIAIPGVPQLSTFSGINVNTNNPAFYNLNFVVDTSSSNIGIFQDSSKIGVDIITDDFKFSIYPNPTKGEFILQLKSSETGNATFEIYNVDGVKCFAQLIDVIKSQSNNIQFDKKKLSLANGIYFVKVQINNKVYLKKLVVIGR